MFSIINLLRQLISLKKKITPVNSVDIANTLEKHSFKYNMSCTKPYFWTGVGLMMVCNELKQFLVRLLIWCSWFPSQCWVLSCGWPDPVYSTNSIVQFFLCFRRTFSGVCLRREGINLWFQGTCFFLPLSLSTFNWSLWFSFMWNSFLEEQHQSPFRVNSGLSEETGQSGARSSPVMPWLVSEGRQECNCKEKYFESLLASRFEDLKIWQIRNRGPCLCRAARAALFLPVPLPWVLNTLGLGTSAAHCVNNTTPLAQASAHVSPACLLAGLGSGGCCKLHTTEVDCCWKCAFSPCV